MLKVILADDLPKEPLRQSRKYEKPRAEAENRKVSRCVALIAFLLLAVCFALMGVSFTLTSKIDEMGESLTHRTLGLMSPEGLSYGQSLAVRPPLPFFDAVNFDLLSI